MMKNNMKDTVSFFGIDSCNRPVFKATSRDVFYGDVNNLFTHSAKEEDVLLKVSSSTLEYFGRKFDCEPNGGKANVTIVPSEKTTKMKFTEFTKEEIMKIINAHDCRVKSYVVSIQDNQDYIKELGTLPEAMSLFNKLCKAGEKAIVYCFQSGELDTLKRWDSVN